jgi:DNA polymerase III sliding clamp (beta) subunit (PCNA family)
MFFSIVPSILSSKLQLSDSISSENMVEIEADDIKQEIVIRSASSKCSFNQILKCKVSVPGTVVVHNKTLRDIVKTYTSQINIKKSIAGDKLMLSPNNTFPKKSTISIQTSNLQLPIIDENTIGTPTNEVEVKADILSHAINSAKSFSNGEIAFAIEKDKISISSVNLYGGIVSNIGVLWVNNFTSNVTCVVSLNETKALPISEYNKISIKTYGNLLRLHTGAWDIFLPLSTNKIPSLANISSKNTITTMSTDLLPMLRRADLLVDNLNQTSKTITFKPESDTELSVNINSKTGEYADILRCVSQGVSNDMSFYIKDLISGVLVLSADKINIKNTTSVTMIDTDDKVAGLENIDIKIYVRQVAISNNP